MTELLPMPVLPLLVGVLVTAIAATVQGTIGIGFAVVSVPILSLVDPRLAPIPQVLLAIPLTSYMTYRERHALQLRGVGWVLAGRFPGAGLGVLMLSLATAVTLDVLIGVLVLAATIMLSTKATVKPTRASQFLAGVASGASGLISSIGGPPLALLYRDAKGPEIRANLAALFGVGLVITIAARVLAGRLSTDDVVVSLWLVPGLTLGLFATRWTKERVRGSTLRVAVLGISALAACGLIGRAMLA